MRGSAATERASLLMRHGVPTSRTADQAGALYFRCMFHEWFYGPFETEEALVGALRKLDQVDPRWDYDCFAIHRVVSDEDRARIEEARRRREP